MWGAIVATRVLSGRGGGGGGGGRGRYNGLPWWPKGVNAGGHEKLKLFPKSHLSNISFLYKFLGGGGGGGHVIPPPPPPPQNFHNYMR